MIFHLPNEKIDREKWDRCIADSVNGRIYGCSWFLDIVSPGWEALVEDDYSSVFPLTWNRKYGIRYLFQPYFCQQLGVFGNSGADSFLEQIPQDFKYAEIQMNSDNRPSERYVGRTRRNYELDMSKDYEVIRTGFNQNTRRNIRKAFDKGYLIKTGADPDDIIRLFRENYGSREGKLRDSHYKTLATLMTEAIKRGKAENYTVYGEKGPAAAVFLLKDKNRYIYHFAATSDEGKKDGAMFFIINEIIAGNAGKPVLLDFEGSDDDNVARLYSGFGARETGYPLVVINRLPPVLKAVFAVKKKIVAG